MKGLQPIYLGRIGTNNPDNVETDPRFANTKDDII